MKAVKNELKAIITTVVVTIAIIGLSVCSTNIVNAQGVGINPSGNPPDPSSMLYVSVTAKGVLLNRMTTAQRDAIQSPAVGLLIFNTDCELKRSWRICLGV